MKNKKTSARDMKAVEIEKKLKEAVKGREIPILVLDPRWHNLFPKGNIPPRVMQLEEQVNTLMKEQGKLVNEIKHLKKTKKRLMDGIVSSIGHSSERKSENSKRLILEMNAQIDEKSAKVMELPYKIKEKNEELLLAGMTICVQRLTRMEDEKDSVEAELKKYKELLIQKQSEKKNVDKRIDDIYYYMHDVLGASAMDMFDRER